MLLLAHAAAASEPIAVAFVLTDGANVIDFAGPWEVFQDTARPGTDTIDTAEVRYKTSTGFNAGGLGVVLILIALYATWSATRTILEIGVSPNWAPWSSSRSRRLAFGPATTAITTYSPEFGRPTSRTGPNPGAATM